MLTRIQLENFKSWRELDIQLAPITMLFGTNSSGKSSMLQALLLLMQTADRTNWETVYLGGGKNDYADLGGFREIVFRHELNRRIKIILEWEGFVIPNLRTLTPKHRDSGEVEMWYEGDSINFKIDDLQAWLLEDYVLATADRHASIHYIGPLREHPQRTYLWSGSVPKKVEPDGENTVAVIVASERSDDNIHTQAAEWLIQMGLVDDFTTKALDAGKRFYETSVKIGNVESALLDVGFGISQVLPVITTLFFVPEGSTVLLEQPELHLHPRTQAHLADLFLHIAETRKLQLIVESHSEHLLRRLQRRIAEVETPFASPDNIKMYFCEKGENGSTAQTVEVDEYGQILNWPDKFFGDITGDLEKMAMAALQRSANGR